MKKTEFDPIGQKIIDAYLKWEASLGNPDEEPLEPRLDFWTIMDRMIAGLEHRLIGVDCDTGEFMSLYAMMTTDQGTPEAKIYTLVATSDDGICEVIINDGWAVADGKRPKPDWATR